MLATTSTLAFKFRDGVIVTADTAVSYGRLAMTKLNRIFVINNTIITFNGAVGDFLFVKKTLEAELEQDKRYVDSKGIFKLLQLFMYAKRSEAKPKFCSILVAGKDKHGNPFIGAITSKGVFWEDSAVASGFASHLILPLLRDKNTEEMSLEEAKQFALELNKVLVYKDCIASNKIQMAILNKTEKVEILNETVPTSWSIAHKFEEIKL